MADVRGGRGDGRFASDHPVDAVLAFYRDQCARSDAVLSSVALNAEPRGQIPYGMADLSRNVRTIVLHMIEETARHPATSTSRGS